MDSLVSILIPAYNAESYLKDCLESACAQTYSNCEIIVVDDGSTDRTYEIAQQFEGHECKVIRQANRGQAGALNAAMAAAQGEYFQFLDADDILHRDKIRVQMSRYEAANKASVACGAWARFRENVSEARFQPEAVWNDADPCEWLIQSWLGGGMMHVAAWLVPREVATAAGQWEEQLSKAANLDADFFTRAILSSTRVIFCPEARSYYRSGHSSMSNWRDRKSREATLKVLTRNGEALLRRENSERSRRAYAISLQRFVYSCYPDGKDLVSLAECRIRELGGSDLAIDGGRLFLWLCQLFGWKIARRIQVQVQALRTIF